MSFDGIVTRNIVLELNNFLVRWKNKQNLPA